MLTAQVEDYLDVLPELKPLYPAHWEELALNKESVPLSPIWENYVKLHTAGMLLVVTLRDGPKIAGYFLGVIAPALHYSTCITCTSDIYRVLPEYRGRHGGVRLFRVVEQHLKTQGVHRWFVGSKLHKDAGRLFVALGFDPVETYYSKWIGD